MSLKILLGKANTGKSKYIFDCMDQGIKKGKKVTLLVPSQSRLLEEDNYMAYQKKNGIIGINVTTISEYVSSNLRKYNLHIDSKYITKLDKKLILTNIISKNPDIFNFFNKVKSKSGFLEMINIYLEIFRGQKILAEDIEKFNLEDKLVEIKLKEIGTVYKKYLETIESKYVDDVAEVDLFLDKLVQNVNKKNINPDEEEIYFDGYNNFSKSEYELIETFIKNGFNVTISLTTDPEYVEKIEQFKVDSIFEIPNETLYNLIILSKKIGIKPNIENFLTDYSRAKYDLKWLAQNIFLDNMIKKNTTENIHINLTNNVYTELESIANIISKKVREGYSYSDFAIFTSDTKEYSYPIKQVMSKYNIPIYIEQGRFIENSGLLKYIKNLISIICFGLKNEYLFDLLKLDLNDISESDINYFENYVLEFNINKYIYSKEFNLNNEKQDEIIYDLVKINKIRLQILSIFENLNNLSSGKHDIKNIITKIYEHLKSSKVINKFDTKINEMLNFDNPEVIYTANSFSQVYEILSNIFSSISKIYVDEKVDMLEFRQIFEYATKDVKLKSIPPTIDNVSVFDINLNKIDFKKYIFVIGVNENKIPYKVEEDILFSDSDLIKLEKSGLDLRNTTSSKYNMQLFNIYGIFNKALEKLYMYIESTDTSGKALRTSTLVQNILQIIDTKIYGSVSNNEEKLNEVNEIFSLEFLFEFMIRKISELSSKLEGKKDLSDAEEEEIVLLLSLFRYFNSTKYIEILKYIKEDKNLSANTIEKVYETDLKTSVSRLELFKKCPFSYFMNYGLKLKPRKIYSISSIDIGNFMHSVMERFSKYLIEKNIKWHEILLEECNIKVNKKLEAIIEDELDTAFIKHKESIRYVILKQKLISTMKKVVITVARSFNQSEFEPYGYEIEFGHGKVFAPIEIKISENQNMYLIGKIDRIDTMKIDDKIYARVIDYKSSSRELNLDDIKEGYSLQLITYLSSFIENIKEKEKIEVIPSAMLYFNLSDRIVNLNSINKNSAKIEDEITRSLRMKGIFLKDINILSKMDKNFENNERLIEVSKKSLGLSKKKLLIQEEYLKLCKDAKDTLKGIGQEILKGVIKIRPANKKDACKYCNYSSICRKTSCI